VKNAAGSAATSLRFRTHSGSAWNTGQLVLDYSGNVGIGTTGPSSRLSVKSSGSGTQFDIIKSNTANPIFNVVQDATNGFGYSGLFYGTAENVRISSGGSSWLNGGNVGIGTTGPGQHLTVNGPGNQEIEVIAGTDSNPGFRLQNDAANWVMRLDGADSDKFQIREISPSTATRLTIQSGGNVGIGTTGPGALLTSSGTGTQLRLVYGGDQTNLSVNFTVGNAGDLTIDSSLAAADTIFTNSVGIGGNPSGNPVGKFVVYSGLADRKAIIISQASSPTANPFEIQTNAVQPVSYITSSGGAYFSGNVGIGTTGPGSLLTVSGSTSVLNSIINTGTSSSTAGGFVQLMSNDSAALASGDRLGGVLFAGSISSVSTSNGGGITAFTDGT